MKKPSAKWRKTYGEHGNTVRVWREGDLVRVRWRERGIRKTKSWTFSTEAFEEAKAFAKAM